MATKCILDGRMPIYSTCIWSLNSSLWIHSDTPSRENLKEPKQDNSSWKWLEVWFNFYFPHFVNDMCFSWYEGACFLKVRLEIFILLDFLVCELPYRELERRIGVIPWRIWVKKQGDNHHKSYWTKKHSKLSESPKREQPPKLRTLL